MNSLSLEKLKQLPVISDPFWEGLLFGAMLSCEAVAAVLMILFDAPTADRAITSAMIGYVLLASIPVVLFITARDRQRKKLAERSAGLF